MLRWRTHRMQKSSSSSLAHPILSRNFFGLVSDKKEVVEHFEINHNISLA